MAWNFITYKFVVHKESKSVEGKTRPNEKALRNRANQIYAGHEITGFQASKETMSFTETEKELWNYDFSKEKINLNSS